MSDTEKDLTYEEAKELCKKAFDAGVDYESTCSQYNCNAVAYDWEHWLKKNERLFMPKPTVEDVLRQFLGECENASMIGYDGVPQEVFAEYAAKLRLAGDE